MCKKYFFLIIFLLSYSLLSAQVKQDKVNKETTKPTIESEVKKSPDLHLASKNINSAAAATPYDFTTSVSIPGDQFYGGTAAAVEVEPGVWAMARGDANGNGAINATDYLIVQANIGAGPYSNSDLNLNGAVNATDYLFIQPNIGKNSTVP